MKCFRAVAVFLSFFLFSLSPCQRPPLAIIYAGPGACPPNDGDCARAAAVIAQKAGYSVAYIYPGQITLQNLKTAKLYIQPGGEALIVNQHLKPSEMTALRQFVYEGGNYIGFCAGAFFAGPWLDDYDTIPGLNIVPAYTYGYGKDKKPIILRVNWSNQKRYMYFQDGAAFKVEPRYQRFVVAQYESTRTPAVMYSYFGSGKVALAGVHPEAPTWWAKSDGLYDPDGDDSLFALHMFQWIQGH